jgi:hypothetical protein
VNFLIEMGSGKHGKGVPVLFFYVVPSPRTLERLAFPLVITGHPAVRGKTLPT